MDKATKYKYVLSVVNGVVREVYEAKVWYQYNLDRIAFEGEVTCDPISALKGKLIPKVYRMKGNANPFLYKK